MKRIIAAAVALAILVTPAKAQASGSFETGNSLYTALTSEKVSSRTHALGYVIGVHDALVLSGLVCSPSQLIQRQVRDVVQRSLTNAPELLHFGAAELIAVALIETWPCADSDTPRAPRAPAAPAGRF